MKRKTPRIIVIVLISLALFATMIMTALPGSSRVAVADFFGRVFDPVLTFFQSSIDTVGDFFSALSENKALKKENAELLEENVALRQDIRVNEEKVKAYDELEETLNLKGRFSNYEIIGGVVLNRSIGQMFDLFRINLGREDGITVSSDRSYPVFDSQYALVGRLFSSELGSSRVIPLTHEGFSASVKVQGSASANFRLRGSTDYKDQGLCLIDQLAEGTPIRRGDTIVTSGDGGLYPEGIVIGAVVEIIEDSQSKSVQALVEPACDLNQLDYVFVLLDDALDQDAGDLTDAD